MKTFTEQFITFGSCWTPWRAQLEHDLIHSGMLFKPLATDEDFYVWTSPASPHQRPDYGLFGNWYGSIASIDVGHASGAFGLEAGNIHLVLGHNLPDQDEYITLWSGRFLCPSELRASGTRPSVPLIESEWQEGIATKA
jgi:hypothetical protein